MAPAPAPIRKDTAKAAAFAAKAPAPAGGPAKPRFSEIDASLFLPLEELKGMNAGNNPYNIDMSQKEYYLADDEFGQVFGMTKANFSKLPKWKGTNAKKKAGLW